MNEIHPGKSGMKEKVQLFITGELDEGEHMEVFDWINCLFHSKTIPPFHSKSIPL